MINDFPPSGSAAKLSCHVAKACADQDNRPGRRNAKSGGSAAAHAARTPGRAAAGLRGGKADPRLWLQRCGWFIADRVAERTSATGGKWKRAIFHCRRRLAHL